MKQNRREWLKSSLGIGGLILAPSTFLNANEEKKFNQREYNLPIKLSSNENPMALLKEYLKELKNLFNMAVDILIHMPMIFLLFLQGNTP